MSQIQKRTWQTAEFEAQIHDKQLKKATIEAETVYTEDEDKRLTEAMNRAIARKKSNG